jgi:cytochrome c oxidase assembly factor CtaG
MRRRLIVNNRALQGYIPFLLFILFIPFASLLTPAAPGLPPLPSNLWSYWNWQPLVLLGLGLTAALYGRGVWRLWGRAGRGQGIHYWQVVAFGAGLTTLAVALLSPLNALAQALFSAHMVQHLLMIVVAAPLLVMGAPLLPFIWSLPKSTRQAVGQGWKRAPLIQQGGHTLTQPLVVWVLYTVTLWAWHLPALYQAALEKVWVHEVEHLAFLGTALLFWWLVIQPTGRRRLDYGAGILFIFTAALHNGALGALLAFARTPLYPIYTSSVAGWNMSLLEDQQLAGLIMWIPPSVIYVVTALTLLGAWLQSLERAEDSVASASYPALSATKILRKTEETN